MANGAGSIALASKPTVSDLTLITIKLSATSEGAALAIFQQCYGLPPGRQRFHHLPPEILKWPLLHCHRIEYISNPTGQIQ
jgi:hypothetical protein